MAYIINKFNGEALLTLQDGTVDSSTSIKLVGRNYVGYGEIQNENFLYLMENFANDFPPPRPLAGQTWFDTDDHRLSVFDGTRWASLGFAAPSYDTPVDPPVGMLWFKQPDNALYIYGDAGWVLIGPDSIVGWGETGAESTTVLDSNGLQKPVIISRVDGIIVSISSSTPFILADGLIAGFTNIPAGITLSDTMHFRGTLEGIAYSAYKLENTLTNGTHIIGDEYDGSSPATWAVDATELNENNKIVMRDSNGDFSASTITAASFLGTSVTAANIEAGNIEAGNQGITVGSGSQLTLSVNGTPSIVSTTDLNIDVDGGPLLSLITSSTSVALGAYNAPAIISRNLINLGLPTNKFDNVHANMLHGLATSAQYADLAEYYSADDEYAPGTVLIFGGNREVTTTTAAGDSRLAGVVTTDPGFIMNTALTGLRAAIALQGRVPVKVYGQVAKGAMLVSSSHRGYAEAATNPAIGTVIGKALEDKITTQPELIEVSIGKM